MQDHSSNAQFLSALALMGCNSSQNSMVPHIVSKCFTILPTAILIIISFHTQLLIDATLEPNQIFEPITNEQHEPNNSKVE